MFLHDPTRRRRATPTKGEFLMPDRPIGFGPHPSEARDDNPEEK